MFDIFITNDLIATDQSGFKPGDSCINQLVSITHGIYESFNEEYEVRGVFLEISKAFDNVWHEGLIRTKWNTWKIVTSHIRFLM